MKCLLIGIALSACLSVWTGSGSTRLTALDQARPNHVGATNAPAAIR
jgi:hypothetical protein